MITPLAWDAEMPVGWGVKRAKFILRRMQRPVGPEDDVVTAFRDGEVTLRKKRRPEGYTESVKEIGYQGVRRGDLVVHVMDAFAGAIGVSDSDGKSTPVYSVCTSQPEASASMRYYAYFLRHMAASGLIQSLTRGIRERSTEFRYAELKELRLPEPPPAQQREIADFLDRETLRIAALMAKEQRLLELLHEQRNAFISHVVTGGLDPDVPMKVSDIKWLAVTPRHWQVSQLRRLVHKFVDYRGATPAKTESGVPLITAKNIKNGSIDFSESREYISEEDYASWMVRGLPRTGDVVVTTEAPLGDVAQIDDSNVALAQRLILLKANRQRVQDGFLMHVLMSACGRGELDSRATGSTALGIKASHLRSILVPTPPLEEQGRIVDAIERDADALVAIEAAIRRAVDRLREYRSALITAAVTGQIDVRSYHRDPEEVLEAS